MDEGMWFNNIIVREASPMQDQYIEFKDKLIETEPKTLQGQHGKGIFYITSM